MSEKELPKISHETYLALLTKKQRQNYMKIEAFDIQNQIEEQERVLQQVRENLQAMILAIKNSEDDLREMLRMEVEEPLDLVGKKYSIADEEPHHITVF